MSDDIVSSVSKRGANEFQRVLQKQRADKIKLDIKKLLKNIDLQNLGSIQFEVFLSILALNKIKLNDKDVQRLRLESRAKPKVGGGDMSDFIDYKTALRLIDVNFELEDAFSKDWILRNKAPSQAASTVAWSRINSYVDLNPASASKMLNLINGNDKIFR